MNSNIISSFQSLKSYLETENFQGWDPYDGLNSKVFQATPLKHWKLARLAWIQAFKRNPINLRRLLLVPKGYNPKGVALALSGYCNLYHLAEKGETTFGTTQAHLEKIHFLADLLLELQSKGYSGACWGYNFDWQARGDLFFPKGTPTIVPTAYCVEALFSAYEITKKEAYYQTALSSAQFVLKDLNRTAVDGGYILSYSPVFGNNTVYNASLLGGKILSRCYAYTHNESFKEEALKIVNAAVKGQAEDGSWVYGLLSLQNWIDSFHTGYNLDAIHAYSVYCNDDSFQNALTKGLTYYLNTFFEEDGTPKYYHNKTYPIDIHCPAQLLVTLAHLGKATENKELIEKVLSWTIQNMQDKKGYFYYQLKEKMSSKIAYMRWSNAFMFHAFTCYFLGHEH